MKVAIVILVLVGGYYLWEAYKPVPPPPPAPSPAPRLAPPGIYFTKERFSEKTDIGVRALKAGAEVKMLSQGDKTSVVVDASNNEFNIPTELLTNDLDVRDEVLKKIAEQSSKESALPDPSAVAREARVVELQREVERQNLRLEELSLSLKRAEEDLAKEAAKGPSLSGGPSQNEQTIRRKIEQLKEQVKISQRKIEDAKLAIKKIRFNDQPLPLKAPRP